MQFQSIKIVGVKFSLHKKTKFYSPIYIMSFHNIVLSL